MWGRRTLAPRLDYEDQAGYIKPVLITPGGDEDRRSLHITFVGTYAEQMEMDDEMRRGLRCTNCAEALPAPPDVRNLPLYREAYGKNPADLLDRQLALAAQGCCPFCGFEVREEMYRLLHMGTIPEPTKD